MTPVLLFVIVARMAVQVRQCSEADLATLLRRWPIVGGVHESHIVEGDYLVAWGGASHWAPVCCAGPAASETTHVPPLETRRP